MSKTRDTPKNILKILLLIFILVSSQSCKKVNPTNKIYRDQLIEDNVSNDSIERMGVVFDKLDLKNTTFLDYFYITHYHYDIEATKSLRKMELEEKENLGVLSDAYWEKHHTFIVENCKKYNDSLQITKEEQRLINEMYFTHLKPLIETKIDEKLATVER